MYVSERSQRPPTDYKVQSDAKINVAFGMLKGFFQNLFAGVRKRAEDDNLAKAHLHN